MPKAEVGSVKHLNKQMKQKGLTRLRWYCQICEKACRDENAFKQHTLSESHVRQALTIGRDATGAINEYSQQFLSNFTSRLRTAHGTKPVVANHFYQEILADKSHIHLNATKWGSLTELIKYLGREGICRVEESERGLMISWVDTSPEALKREAAVRKREALERGDEEREQRLLKEQIKRAKRDDKDEEEKEEEDKLLQRAEGEKVTLSFGVKSAAPTKSASPDKDDATPTLDVAEDKGKEVADAPPTDEQETKMQQQPLPSTKSAPAVMKIAAKPQIKNVFAQAKKQNALAAGGSSKGQTLLPKGKIAIPKKMSEAERIMREEMDRKRPRDASGSGISFGFGGANKRQKM